MEWMKFISGVDDLSNHTSVVLYMCVANFVLMNDFNQMCILIMELWI